VLHRLLDILSFCKAGSIVLTLLAASALTQWAGGFLVVATNLPDLGTMHVLSRALDLDPGPERAVTLINITDKDHTELGAPLPMEKAYLVELVERLRPLGPAAILVDYDISQETAPDDMASLRTLLSGWGEDAPLLMFPRELIPTESGEMKTVSTPFDDFFSEARPLYWTSTMFQNSEGHQLDEWTLWTTPQGSCEALLAPQLLLHLHRQFRSTDGLHEAAAHLAKADGREGCEQSPSTVRTSAEIYAGLEDRQKAPVYYVLGDDLDQGPSQDLVDLAGRSEPAFYVWSAGEVLSKGVASASIKDRVVIIGGAYAGANDRHDTPVGRMDGARILANAVSTGDRTLEAETLPPLLITVVITTLSVLSLYGFLTFKPIIFGVLGFGTLVITYASAIHLYDVSTASLVARGTIGLTAVLIGTKSFLDLLHDLVIERLGWRSLLENP